MFACGSFVHQRCSNYALTSLLFGLCRSMWIIDLLVTCINPHPRVPTCPFTFEVLRAEKRIPTPYPSIVFTFGLTVESIKEFGVCQWIVCRGNKLCLLHWGIIWGISSWSMSFNIVLSFWCPFNNIQLMDWSSQLILDSPIPKFTHLFSPWELRRTPLFAIYCKTKNNW
jgi:hypothetical protein